MRPKHHSPPSRAVKPLALLRACGLAVLIVAPPDAGAAPPPQRARPPKFSKSVTDAFFSDAREKLSGPRPKEAARPDDAQTVTAPDSAEATAAGAKQSWSKLIAADVVEDEIKAQLAKLDEALATASKFRGGDYQRARQSFAVLATMFAIDAQYDGKMRWQRDAATMRDLLTRASMNCKVGTDGSYHEARARLDDLQNLVRGGSLSSGSKKPDGGWTNVADRSQLMKRLEQSQQRVLQPWTANDKEFSRHAESLSHEAQLVAALAAVIQREGYEFADDPAYREIAEEMQKQAIELREAVARGDASQARETVGKITKTCSDCHEGYRN